MWCVRILGSQRDGRATGKHLLRLRGLSSPAAMPGAALGRGLPGVLKSRGLGGCPAPSGDLALTRPAPSGAASPPSSAVSEACPAGRFSRFRATLRTLAGDRDLEQNRV